MIQANGAAIVSVAMNASTLPAIKGLQRFGSSELNPAINQILMQLIAAKTNRPCDDHVIRAQLNNRGTTTPAIHSSDSTVGNHADALLRSWRIFIISAAITPSTLKTASQ